MKLKFAMAIAVLAAAMSGPAMADDLFRLAIGANALVGRLGGLHTIRRS